MRPGWAARRCIAAIERYRRWGAGRGSGCRFEPSCSTFALEAMRTRVLLFAIGSSAWRILRCTPLVARGTHDPVAPHRPRPRPGTARTASVIAALSGLFLLGLVTSALGQSVTGGCTATAGGRDPVTLTRSNPLLVAEGQVVDVTGQAPPGSASGATATVVVVKVLEGISGPDVVKNFTGQGTSWGGEADVDEFLRYSVGLYRVEASGTGPGWACTASGYVKLKGNPLSKPAGQAAAVLTAVGGAGIALSSRPRREPEASAGLTAEEIKQGFGKDVDNLVGSKPEKKSIWERDLKGNAFVEAGCAFFLFGPLGMEGASGGAVAASSARSRTERVWVHGHPVWGALSGLGLGTGLAVLGQQLALWPLTVFTAIAFPVYAAVVGGVRAWIGRAYVRIGHAPASAPPMPPPAPPPMP